jgi:hypothetical protein
VRVGEARLFFLTRGQGWGTPEELCCNIAGVAHCGSVMVCYKIWGF